MLPTEQGSIRLFRFAGIQVYLHWSWLLVAVYQINTRAREYSSPIWNVLEYLALFCIVLMHEFGHSLACRQVGGKAERIVLWPLGGVAYVSPPPRPGATLWSIAAGPLVNLILLPVFSAGLLLAQGLGWRHSFPNLYGFAQILWMINLALLVFNLLPVYPLDGGQILRSLLWFLVGRARSLHIASAVGLVGVALLLLLALWARSFWLGLLSVFILIHCWGGFKQARLLATIGRLPRRPGFACPSCRHPPLLGPFWRCAQCAQQYDIFETSGSCPYCGAVTPATVCIECGDESALGSWVSGDSFR